MFGPTTEVVSSLEKGYEFKEMLGNRRLEDVVPRDALLRPATKPRIVDLGEHPAQPCSLSAHVTSATCAKAVSRPGCDVGLIRP